MRSVSGKRLNSWKSLPVIKKENNYKMSSHALIKCAVQRLTILILVDNNDNTT